MVPVKVLVVDDHEVVRQGLRAFLELLEEIDVVGEAKDGLDAVAKAEILQPDVILMDLVMPGMDGIEATRRITTKNPEIKIIVLTSFTEDEKVFPAIQAGATSYLLKDVKPNELAQAVVAASRGESQLHPEITRKLMSQVAEPDEVDFEEAHTSLTGRELEVLELIGKGKSNREISQLLGISPKTVKTHVSNILGKLNVADRTQAAIYAHEHDLYNKSR